MRCRIEWASRYCKSPASCHSHFTCTHLQPIAFPREPSPVRPLILYRVPQQQKPCSSLVSLQEHLSASDSPLILIFNIPSLIGHSTRPTSPTEITSTETPRHRRWRSSTFAGDCSEMSLTRGRNGDLYISSEMACTLRPTYLRSNYTPPLPYLLDIRRASVLAQQRKDYKVRLTYSLRLPRGFLFSKVDH